MAKKRPQKKNAESIIREQFNQLNGLVLVAFLLAFLALLALFVGVVGVVWQGQPASYLPELVLAAGIILALYVVIFLLIQRVRQRTQALTTVAIDNDLNQLRVASNRAKSLQQMAATLSATLSFDRVMEVALDVSSLALEEMGVPAQSLVGAVFLYEGENLFPVASRRFSAHDVDRRISGKSGFIGRALKDAEATLTSKPGSDPELRQFAAFQSCQTAVCVPLRAGFQLFGAMVLGSEFGVQFNADHLELFNAVADQAVVALQNAQLYQDLNAEKQRIIEADEEARKELARNLHDGPTQSVAAIAMHINFIRSLMVKDPRQALTELAKVEKLAKATSKEIRSMLFALRPLVLESDGLGAAVEAVMDKIRETDRLNMRLVGGEFGDLLNEQAQGVVFSIIEEALGNARKYSQASLVEVRMWREGDLFVARVQDDGVGFDVAAVNSNYSSRGSLGMVNMRERAERIDGSLKVESAPGRGTSVTLVVPLEKQGKTMPEHSF